MVQIEKVFQAARGRCHLLGQPARRQGPSLLLASLELSDTHVYELEVRAFLGTASHFCEGPPTTRDRLEQLFDLYLFSREVNEKS